MPPLGVRGPGAAKAHFFVQIRFPYWSFRKMLVEVSLGGECVKTICTLHNILAHGFNRVLIILFTHSRDLVAFMNHYVIHASAFRNAQSKQKTPPVHQHRRGF
jgi:hypothetical protein